MKTKIIIYLMLLFLFSMFDGYSNNPDMSKYLKNLSAATNKEAVDDIASEIIVEGNTVHVVWLEDKYGVQNPLYYCRSLDLGKTWQTPVLISKLVDGQYARQPNNRKLAVDGNDVHIAYCDYSYSETGTGRIYYARSTNNGASFEPLKELATTGGGYNAITRSFVKASNGKVAVAYVGGGAKTGVWVLHSATGGTNFTDTKVFEEGNDLADFYFDGNQMIILHSYAYFYFGLHTGRVYVTVSNNNGTTVVTNKVSVTFPEGTQQREKCMARHDYHYVKKIAKSGDNIHVVFEGQTETAGWTILYARSTNNGTTFEKAIDINSGTISNIQGGQETILANNGNVYIAYLSTQDPVYFSYSNNNGNTFSKSMRITPVDVSHISGTWWIGLVNDPTDVTGKSFYLTGNYMYSAKSVDGGKSFSKFSIAAPFLKSIIADIRADMVIDSKGGMHWISETRFKNGTDRDIMYRNILTEPEPGNVNKALSIKNVKTSYEMENVVVPSSSAINFDSVMTAEAWVKFPPGNEDAINILAKVDGLGNWDYLPSGYNMGFRVQNTGKLCINSGIKTDKGDFINWGDCTIADTLWHHVAFTYDANAGLNNFKTYIDGIMLVQQTVTGKIIHNEGLLFIGVRMATASWYTSQNYYIDDVRLWNKALSQTELMANQVKKFTGREEGLKLYINFDDTFKDISGNGNDGIPIYNGILTKSDFNPPITDFEMYQAGNEISFNNKTTNATSSYWDFGNSVNSDQGNPRYVYPNPGEFHVTLLAKNSNSVAAALNNVTITGINKIEPETGGNIGLTSVDIYGGGLTENSIIKLVRAGEKDITGQNKYIKDIGILSVTFNLAEVKTGDWNLTVTNNTSTYSHEKAFKVVDGIVPKPWVTVTGRGTVLVNRWFTSYVNFGNNGNADLKNVPIFIAISDIPGLETEFIDFELDLDDTLKAMGLSHIINEVPVYFKKEKFFDDGSNAIIFPLIIESIPQNYSGTLSIRVKSPQSYELWAWTYPISPKRYQNSVTQNELTKSGSNQIDPQIGFFDWDVWTGSCIRDVFIGGLWDLGGSVYDLLSTGTGFGCVKSTIDAMISSGWTIYEGKPSINNAIWDISSIAVNCAADQIPAAKAYKVALGGISAFMNLYSNAKRMYDCINTLNEPIYGKKKTGAVSSFDPNEMVGPSGYGSENFIQKNKLIPYTILFENKSTATAPAHEVFITDTLDLKKFDISEFGFGAFGWSDSIYFPGGNKQIEFSKDIDLRPSKNLITRVSGKLDTLSGVVRWEFVSLNPTTMDYEEDPFIGFLPPNDTSRAGEGFVSFSVGLRKELKTNDVLINKASIVFDANSPIITNEYINTLDMDTPESIVLPLPENNKNHFLLSWAGNDVGSGIAYYDVYVMENDTSLRIWKSRTTLGSAEFIGNLGSQYKFYSMATDNVSLIEENPTGYDAETTITVNVQEFDNKKGNILIWPNPANNNLNIQFTDAPSGVYVLETINSTGNTILSKIYTDADVKKGVNINIKEYTPGLYFLRIVYQNRSETLKFIVQ